MIKNILLILGFIFITGMFFTVGAEEMGELHITVMFEDADVSLESQVMLMKDHMPIILSPGQEKKSKIAAGTYDIVANLPQNKEAAYPGGGKVEVKPGEVKRISIKLQNMSAMMGGHLPDMADVMKDEEEFVPEEATEAELQDALEDEDEEIYRTAFNELYSREKNPFLAEMLDHSRGEIRELSLNKLGMLTAEAKIGHPSAAEPIEENKEKIIKCLDDPYLPARIKAIGIMGNYPKFPYEVLPTLIKALEDPEVDVRSAAVSALGTGLGSEGKEEKEVIKALVARVEKDEEARVRRGAVYSLGQINTKDSRVYKSLAVALSDDDPEVRRTSAGVLSKLGASASILNEMIAALKYPDSYLRSDLLRAMQKLDSAELERIVHPVSELLDDESAFVREQAIGVIRAAGPAGAEVLPALINALSDKSNNVTIGVIRTLDKLGPEYAGEALPELLELIKGESSGNLGALAKIMVTIGEPAIPPMIELLSHNNYEVRGKSASILGSFGPGAEDAVPMLNSIYEDENENEMVRRQAYFAIGKITGKSPE
ncbi:MAG: HEAT repeat domain-containing protein [Halanaerobiales bacterium]